MSPPQPRYPPIRDHGVIGDCRTAALVASDGTVDWLCLPRFDSPAVFAAILDADQGGRFTIRPTNAFRSEQTYEDGTNLLVTTFATASGRLRLIDGLMVEAERERRLRLEPSHELLREVTCLEGEVELEVLCDPRPGFGKAPQAHDRGALGLSWTAGSLALALQSEIPLSFAGTRATARATLRAGDRRFLSLVSAHGEPLVLPALGEAAAERLAHTRRWWEEWVAGIVYEGPRAPEVVRSALALKLLTHAPSGAVIAAPTTSLPEEIGGVRNWDYRYCWLRDASWTLTAFLDLGLREEGAAFLSWLLNSTRMGRTRINVLYDVFGRARLREREISWLEGYAGSRPVRVGNAAAHQFQLDIYGEVIECAYQFVVRGGTLEPAEARLLAELGETVCAIWREPDEGIWEKRSGRFHHTYSKAMCWVALDRLCELAERGVLTVPVARFAEERATLRDCIESQAWNAELGSYADVLGGDGLDASLLLLGLRGYDDPARSPRLQATFRTVRERLERGGLLYRYPPGDDGLPGGEGAFGICSFWVVEFLARAGAVDEALAHFEKVLALASPLRLYAEQIDPASGAFLGNFPQAFTHVGLISAALALTTALGGSRGPADAAAGAEGMRI